MTDTTLLIITLIIWIIGVFVAYKTDTNWLYALSGLLWFVPVFIVPNIFIIIFSIVMILFSFLYAFVKEE